MYIYIYEVILSHGPQCLASEDRLTREALLKVSAIALVWPPAQQEWASAVTGWKSLLEQRRSSSSELQKELQIQMRLRPLLLALGTESLAASWTVLAALRSFGASTLDRQTLRVAVALKPSSSHHTVKISLLEGRTTVSKHGCHTKLIEITTYHMTHDYC